MEKAEGDRVDIKSIIPFKEFVGNVPFDCRDDDFKKVFKDKDGFVNAELIHRKKSALTRGFGFVAFDSREKATKLIQEGTMKIGTRELRFSAYDSDRKPRPRPQKETDIGKLYVRNLPRELTILDFSAYFSKFGTLVNSYLITDSETRTHKGAGVLCYTTDEEATSVIEQVHFIGSNRLQIFRYHKPINKFSSTKAAYNAGLKEGYYRGFQLGRFIGEKGEEGDGKSDDIFHASLPNFSKERDFIDSEEEEEIEDSDLDLEDEM